MSGLPSGQFVDYLVIGIFAAAAVTLFGALVHGAIKNDPGKTRAVIAIPILVALAVLGHFAVQKLMPPERVMHVQIDPSPLPSNSPSDRLGNGPSPTPVATPVSGSITVPSSTALPERQEKSFVESFVRTNIAPLEKSRRRSGQWAVIISEQESRESYPRLASAVASMVAETGHSTVAMFRPSATHGAGFDTLFAADPTLSRQLNEYCDQILLGKVKSSIQENPDYPGLHKLTMTIDVKIISTSSGNVQQIQAAAVGAGYEIGEARSNAEENLATSLRSELHNIIR
jgi:hypothetical protein